MSAIIRPGLVLLAICILAASVLTMINHRIQPVIAEAQRGQQLSTDVGGIKPPPAKSDSNVTPMVK
jgi:hypothetical protein